MQPIDQPPIRICDFKKTNRQKYQERRDRNQAGEERPAIICGPRSSTSDLWIGPILPAQPKKNEGEEGNEPAITILVVDRPLVAQLPEKDKPKRADSGDNQRGASKTKVASRGYRLCLREN